MNRVPLIYDSMKRDNSLLVDLLVINVGSGGRGLSRRRVANLRWEGI